MQIVESFLTENPCYGYNVQRADNRYIKFQDEGPKGLMLHSVGCAQPDASVFISRWNKPTYTNACVHAFIDANSGVIFQTLPWNYRGWHCGSGANGSSNNTHCGIEMCESKYIKYTTGAKFEILDAAKAKADAKRTYDAAVELFAFLCEQYAIDPMTAGILSHNEGGKQGIASGHVDPEHYWTGLGLDYTMDKFRAAVKKKLQEMDAATDGPIYRVQVGAFRKKEYADLFLRDVQTHYPNAYLTTGGGK